MQSITNVIAGIFEPYDFETITVSNSAIGLTASKYTAPNLAPLKEAQYIILTLETSNIRYRIDGGVPTSSIGHLLNSGGSLTLLGISNIVNFKAIAVTSDATFMVTYLR